MCMSWAISVLGYPLLMHVSIGRKIAQWWAPIQGNQCPYTQLACAGREPVINDAASGANRVLLLFPFGGGAHLFHVYYVCAVRAEGPMQPPPRVCYFQLLNENIDYYNVIKQALIKTSRQLNFIKFNSNQYLLGAFVVPATRGSHSDIQKAHMRGSRRNSE